MVKLFITDLDGTLTDGGYLVHPQLKGYGRFFNTKDFLGMMLLHQSGVEVAVVTTARQASIEQFERAGKYIQVSAGIHDKYNHVREKYVDSGRFQWEEIAFIGDDLNDLELLNAVGLSACPSDAAELVRESIQKREDSYILLNGGGKGAVREFCDIVLLMIQAPNEWVPEFTSKI
jgi:YrbI family 3-deoxy-D-manno-octulosonate 8-phosphate phosphatase